MNTTLGLERTENEHLATRALRELPIGQLVLMLLFALAILLRSFW